MPPQKDETPSCFVMLLALCFVVFLFFAAFGDFGHGIGWSMFFLVVFGFPIGLFQFFAWLGRKAARRPKAPPKPARTLTKGEMMSAARKRYEETLAGLARTGLDGADLKYAKQKAKQVYLKEINGLLS